MLELLQQGHLSDGGAGDPLLLTLQADLLHGHHLTRGLVSALVNHPVCTCNKQWSHPGVLRQQWVRDTAVTPTFTNLLYLQVVLHLSLWGTIETSISISDDTFKNQ